jgi:hypothetical protein
VEKHNPDSTFTPVFQPRMSQWHTGFFVLFSYQFVSISAILLTADKLKR